MDILSIHNLAGDQTTLVATTNTEVLAALASRARTVAVHTTAVTYFAVGTAATLDSFAVPANTIVVFGVPAGAALNAYSAGTPAVNVHEIKGASG